MIFRYFTTLLLAFLGTQSRQKLRHYKTSLFRHFRKRRSSEDCVIFVMTDEDVSCWRQPESSETAAGGLRTCHLATRLPIRNRLEDLWVSFRVQSKLVDTPCFGSAAPCKITIARSIAVQEALTLWETPTEAKRSVRSVVKFGETTASAQNHCRLTQEWLAESA